MYCVLMRKLVRNMRARQKCRAVRAIANNIWLMYNKKSFVCNGKMMPRSVRHRFVRYTECDEQIMYEPLEVTDLVDKYWRAICEYWYRYQRPFAKNVRKTFRKIGCKYLKKHGEKHKKWW